MPCPGCDTGGIYPHVGACPKRPAGTTYAGLPFPPLADYLKENPMGENMSADGKTGWNTDHANPSISLIDILESAYDAGLADGSLHSDGTFHTWLSAQVEGGALKLEIT